MGRIVVGVDGSAAARDALAWALTQARRTDATVEVVTACPFPHTVGPPGARFPVESHDEVEARWRESQRQMVEEAVSDPAGVDLEFVVRCGQATELLLERADGADLLVVGTRGIGGFRGLLLGSVAQQCVTHAPCPVVVLPPPADRS